MKGIWLIFLFLAGACQGSKQQTPAQPKGPVLQTSDLGLPELRAELIANLLEQNIQVSYGNTEAIKDGIAQDRALQILGVRPKDDVIGVNPSSLGNDRRIYSDRLLRVLSKNLDVHLSEDGSVGWVYDELSYRVKFMGLEASIPLRSTGVYVRDADRWLLVAEHLSYAQSIEDLIRRNQANGLRKSANIKTKREDALELSGKLIGLVGRYVNGTHAEPLSPSSDDVLYLLPGVVKEYAGQDSFQAPSLAELFGDNTSVSIQQYKIEVSSSKRVAWLIVNLKLRIPSTERPLALRGSFLFENRKGQGWGLMQSHISAPISESEMSVQVFGPDYKKAKDIRRD